MSPNQDSGQRSEVGGSPGWPGLVGVWGRGHWHPPTPALTALGSWGQAGRELEPMWPGGRMAPGPLSLVDQDGVSWWDLPETVRRVAGSTGAGPGGLRGAQEDAGRPLGPGAP